VAAANLLAFVFGLRQTRDRAAVADMASNVTVDEFVPSTGVQIAQTDEEYKQKREQVAVGKLLRTFIEFTETINVKDVGGISGHKVLLLLSNVLSRISNII